MGIILTGPAGDWRNGTGNRGQIATAYREPARDQTFKPAMQQEGLESKYEWRM